jgi:hypothetical protein
MEINQKYGNVLNIKLKPNLLYKSQSLLNKRDNITENDTAPTIKEKPTRDQKRTLFILKIFLEIGFMPLSFIFSNAI